jgi:hypothetical protein
MLQFEWPAIVDDLALGHPMKFIWEEKAQYLTAYSNFWEADIDRWLAYQCPSDTVVTGASNHRTWPICDPPATALEAFHRDIIKDYDTWLRDFRGLHPETRNKRATHAQRFTRISPRTCR